jgi:hypothetical protein
MCSRTRLVFCMLCQRADSHGSRCWIEALPTLAATRLVKRSRLRRGDVGCGSIRLPGFAEEDLAQDGGQTVDYNAVSGAHLYESKSFVYVYVTQSLLCATSKV